MKTPCNNKLFDIKSESTFVRELTQHTIIIMSRVYAECVYTSLRIISLNTTKN